MIVEANKRIILYELGIVELPVNNTLTRAAPSSINSSNAWTRPLVGSFKFNFDGVAKGNPVSARFAGAVKN